MSMSVRCEGCGLEYAGARGPAGLFAQPRSALRGRYLRMLDRDPGASTARRAPRSPRTAVTTLTLGRLPRRRRFLAVLRHPLRHPAGRPRSGPAPPRPPCGTRPLPVPFLANHGHAVRQRVAAVADRDRRLARLRRAGRPSSSRPCAPRTPVRAVRRSHGRGRGRHATTAPSARSTRWWSPSTPTRRCGCSPTPPTTSGGSSAPSATRATPPCCTPTPSVLPRARGGPRLVELPDGRPATAAGGRVQVTYDMNRLQRLDAAGGLPRHPERRRPRRRPPGRWRAWSTSTRSTPRSRWPPSAAAALNDGVTAFAGPTTAGASTRTAAAPGSRPPRRWGCAGDARTAAPATSPPASARPRCTVPGPHARTAPVHHACATAPTCGWSTSTACRASPPPCARWPGSTRATTSAAPRRPSAQDVSASCRAGSHLDGGRVLMLTHARVLGHVFNPLTLYWCHDRSRRARLRRRRGAQHLRRAPLLPAAHRRAGPGGRRQGLLCLAVLPGRRRATGCACPNPATRLALTVTLRPRRHPAVHRDRARHPTARDRAALLAHGAAPPLVDSRAHGRDPPPRHRACTCAACPSSPAPVTVSRKVCR